MTRTSLFAGLLLPLIAAFGQTSAVKKDPWDNVRQLKGGTELRVYKTGSATPVQASFADLSDDNLIVVIKNTETAIPRSAIDRIDARSKEGTRRKTETRESESPPDPSASNPREQTGPSTSTSTNLTFGSKGEFQTVYRRTAAEKTRP